MLEDKVILIKYIIVLIDLGYFDGIWCVYFGGGLFFWLYKLLFIDVLVFLLRG